MKIAGLMIGILGMLLSFIVFVVCLLLPSMTHNRINFKEAMVGLIPSAIIGFLAFIVTAISAVMILMAKKNKQIEPNN
jgi:ABC-type antimicrobial peptide transport system permease subunit